MPVILVVDDSPVDQALIGQLIKQEPLDWIIEFADTAEAAIVRLQELAVDVVVTDMMMPGMDGLALLDVVRKQHTETSVILVTGQGNEALAVEALRRGASSYVPKSELAARLKETIKQVLQVVDSDRGYSTLIERVEDIQFRLDLGNDTSLIPPLVHLIQQLVLDIGLCDEDSRRRVGLAVDEALINAIFHGNLELPSHQLNETRHQLRDGARAEAIEQRRAEEPYCNRKVLFEAFLSPQKVRITIGNDGPGFDPTKVGSDDALTPSDSGSEAVESHRGLVLIRNIMDSVEFNSSGNEITMIKYRSDELDDEPIEI